MIWASNYLSGSDICFRVRAGFGPELVGPFTTLLGFEEDKFDSEAIAVNQVLAR